GARPMRGARRAHCSCASSCSTSCAATASWRSATPPSGRSRGARSSAPPQSRGSGCSGPGARRGGRTTRARSCSRPAQRRWVAKGTSAADLDSLRTAIEDTERNARSPLHWLGFHAVTSTLEDAKRLYVSVFQKLVEKDTKGVLQAELVKEDEAGVQAAIAYAA